jgi:hypothetical protein
LSIIAYRRCKRSNIGIVETSEVQERYHIVRCMQGGCWKDWNVSRDSRGLERAGYVLPSHAGRISLDGVAFVE